MTPFALNLVGSNLQLTLVGEVTIEHVGSLVEKLKDTLHPDQTLEVDASKLTRLDAAGLQVFLSAAQFTSDTTLSASSPAWTEAFARYASSDPFRTI